MVLQTEILKIVRAKPGIKAVDLAVQLAVIVPPATSSVAVLDELERLVADGMIVEIEYVLPDTPHKIRSLFFEAGTTIRGS